MLKEAVFGSVRGDFRFNTNHHPIQEYDVREVALVDGTLTDRIISTALTDHADA